MAVREQVNDDPPGFCDRQPCDDRNVIGLEDSSVKPHVGTARLLAVGKRELVPVSLQITQLVKSGRRSV